jgi:hypothetical protein
MPRRALLALARHACLTPPPSRWRQNRVGHRATRPKSTPRLTGLAQAYRYDIAFWWTAAISAGGAITAALLRSGPLAGRVTPGPLNAGRSKLPPKRAAARVLGDYPARPEADGQVAGE